MGLPLLKIQVFLGVLLFVRMIVLSVSSSLCISYSLSHHGLLLFGHYGYLCAVGVMVLWTGCSHV